MWSNDDKGRNKCVYVVFAVQLPVDTLPCVSLHAGARASVLVHTHV